MGGPISDSEEGLVTDLRYECDGDDISRLVGNLDLANFPAKPGETANENVDTHPRIPKFTFCESFDQRILGENVLQGLFWDIRIQAIHGAGAMAGIAYLHLHDNAESCVVT